MKKLLLGTLMASVIAASVGSALAETKKTNPTPKEEIVYVDAKAKVYYATECKSCKTCTKMKKAEAVKKDFKEAKCK